MLNKIFKKIDTISLSALILRITIFTVLFPHGASLMLGWFGGKGYLESMKGLMEYGHLTYFIALIVIMLQFFGPIALALGVYTKYVALAVCIMFIGMIPYHTEYGFFMNWFGSQKGEGYEYHLLVIGITISLLVIGSGKYGLDYFSSKRAKNKIF